jgi:hypothetical protein
VEETAPLSAIRVIVSGILINILNPKLTSSSSPSSLSS